jgi:hypothetical protein
MNSHPPADQSGRKSGSLPDHQFDQVIKQLRLHEGRQLTNGGHYIFWFRSSLFDFLKYFRIIDGSNGYTAHVLQTGDAKKSGFSGTDGDMSSHHKIRSTGFLDNGFQQFRPDHGVGFDVIDTSTSMCADDFSGFLFSGCIDAVGEGAGGTVNLAGRGKDSRPGHQIVGNRIPLGQDPGSPVTQVQN